jgi:hypothetical protein
MYARVNMIFGAKDKVDAGIARIEGSDRRVVEATSGNQGLATMVDREAGVIVAVSFWDEPLYSSDASLTQEREAAAAAAGGDLVVERFELVGRTQPSPAAAGAVVRMARVRLDPAAVADGLGLFTREVLPAVEAAAGLCSAEVLIDRESGDGIIVTVWIDADSADRGERELEPLLDTVTERVGAKFPRTETYTLVRTSALQH